MASPRAFTVPFSDPDDIDVEFDGDDIETDDTIYSELDLDNRCIHPGGHVWLGCASLRPRCIYCGEKAE